MTARSNSVEVQASLSDQRYLRIYTLVLEDEDEDEDEDERRKEIIPTYPHPLHKEKVRRLFVEDSYMVSWLEINVRIRALFMI
jgi:hypothetical protein